jgi:type I restriction-modification system DNA methylase subunit
MQVIMHDLLKSLPPIQDALKRLSESGVEARGAIFTRREVVEFILDLCGYTPDQELVSCRLLEPSVGDGDFLLPVVERLIKSLKPRQRKLSAELIEAIRGSRFTRLP